MKFSAPRGTKDILPEEIAIWQKIEEKARQIFALFNYHEIRTPIFEATDLFVRSIGDGTDIVSKEMYTFLDKSERSITLRPEETAPVVRAAIEHNLLSLDRITKLYYMGPMFRYERPQAGRYRQFNQIGVEAFGAEDALLDVEVMILAHAFFKGLGLEDLVLNLNSVGCKKDQAAYKEKIKHHLKENLSKLCDNCQNRWHKNPLRVLDCKEEKCQKLIDSAPKSTDFLCQKCNHHLNQVQAGLKQANIDYKLNHRLVRGLDYYTGTAFEIISEKLGAQNAVCGGGRYDDLVQELGGKSIPAIGFAIGIERLVEVLKAGKVSFDYLQKIELFIAWIGEEAKQKAFEILKSSREKGVCAEIDYLGKSLKAQMKLADKLKAKEVLIIGEEELKKGKAILKNMQTGEQKEIDL